MSKYLPTPKQHHALVTLLADALIELRQLGWNGHAQQAGDLANALHNLPLGLYDVAYDWHEVKASLIIYEVKYQGHTMFTYVERFGEIEDNP